MLTEGIINIGARSGDRITPYWLYRRNEDITAAGCLVINPQTNKVLVFARHGNETELGLLGGRRQFYGNEVESLRNCAIRKLNQEARIYNPITVSDQPFFVAYSNNDSPKFFATYLAYYRHQGPFPLDYEGGNLKGYAMWATPEQFSNNSLRHVRLYNEQLLETAYR